MLRREWHVHVGGFKYYASRWNGPLCALDGMGVLQSATRNNGFPPTLGQQWSGDPNVPQWCNEIHARYLSAPHTHSVPCYGWYDSPEGGNALRIIVGVQTDDNGFPYVNALDFDDCCQRYAYMRGDVAVRPYLAAGAAAQPTRAAVAAVAALAAAPAGETASPPPPSPPPVPPGGQTVLGVEFEAMLSGTPADFSGRPSPRASPSSSTLTSAASVAAASGDGTTDAAASAPAQRAGAPSLEATSTCQSFTHIRRTPTRPTATRRTPTRPTATRPTATPRRLQLAAYPCATPPRVGCFHPMETRCYLARYND